MSSSVPFVPAEQVAKIVREGLESTHTTIVDGNSLTLVVDIIYG